MMSICCAFVCNTAFSITVKRFSSFTIVYRSK